MATRQSQIREILAENGRLAVPVDSLDENADLFVAGLDSLAIVNVLMRLEEQFDIELPDEMLQRNRFPASRRSILSSPPDRRRSRTHEREQWPGCRHSRGVQDGGGPCRRRRSHQPHPGGGGARATDGSVDGTAGAACVGRPRAQHVAGGVGVPRAGAVLRLVGDDLCDAPDPGGLHRRTRRRERLASGAAAALCDEQLCWARSRRRSGTGGNIHASVCAVEAAEAGRG